MEMPTVLTNLNILVLDALSNELLDEFRVHLPKLLDHLREGVSVNILTLDDCLTAEINDFVFILASGSSVASKIQSLEHDLKLKSRCDLLLVIPIADQQCSHQDSSVSDLPAGYRSIGIEHGATSDDSSRKDRLASLLLSIITSIFSDGHCCVDPVDFISYCAMVNSIEYHRFERGAGGEIVSELVALIKHKDAIDGVFVCINNNSELKPLESLVEVTVVVEDKLPASEFALVSVPFFYDDSVSSLKIDVFIGFRRNHQAQLY